MLQPVDSLDIQIIVDNSTDMLSSTPVNVESEAVGLFKRGARMLGGLCLCCAAHGLSCLITAKRGNTTHTVLFDTGPEEQAFERNVSRLAVDLGTVDSIVLSHGHWDHAGALLLALSMIHSRKKTPSIPFYGHPDMFFSRAITLAGGLQRPMVDIPSEGELTAFGADVRLTRQATALHDGMFLVSGEIARVTPFERGFPGQVRLNQQGQWEPDELMMDERWLGIDVKDKGLVIFSACSHAGVVNVLKDAKRMYPDRPIHAVFGGFHLSGPNESVIDETVQGLKEFDLQLIGAGHCTGWRAMAALSNAFGDQVLAPTAVGKRYSI
jgi:7,8-dihydropterin-6-yl-methyl-4-(beta-D-ribofuranosyl)aminobenzene 5'-phosphate synthase